MTQAAEPSGTNARSLRLTGLDALMADGEGDPAVTVAVIDGPADGGHPALPSTASSCRSPTSPACLHGTFVLGMLAAPRGGGAPAICPGCTFVSRPVLCEPGPGHLCPETTPAALAEAVEDCVAAGARVINISLGLATPILQRSPAFDAAIDHARDRGVVVITAAGNHGRIGPAPLMAHPWLVPVAACDTHGRPRSPSNLGIGIGRRGLLAPGLDIVSTAPRGEHARMSGTSVAAPFVTGTAALLWSLRPALPAVRIRAALLRPDAARRSIVPPRLDATAARHTLGL
ncbi:S8 family peptidase [Actinomadura violacea]|uniref:S8 family serine peptidase n=1 Tax=Actinomadura violacea TaxID=2819934 RepID=A0ABS3S8U4_9ACTN|nr:S8 family serine peptidase [Actinomadura violacea]MBO2465439.1 S8 family serine peptidase [Actinomadura violacea]